MLRNYIITALRNLKKNKSFSFINIIGLALSMSVCMLIISIVTDYTSYDQFHSKKDRIYLVEMQNLSRDFTIANSPLPLGEKLRHNYTGIETTASLVKNIGGDILYNEKFASGAGYFADGELFKVFDFKLKIGDAKTALKNPFSMVISEEIAIELFQNENPIGKLVKFNDRGINPGGPEVSNKETEYGTFTITGVLKPNEGKTHLPFKLLASLSTLPALTKDSILNITPNDWDNVSRDYTYVLMPEGKNKAELQQILDDVSQKQYGDKKVDKYKFVAQPLLNIIMSNTIGIPCMTLPLDIFFVLSVLCLLIMLSACLNYTNLSVARALTRTKEVGIRKVVGASRRQVFLQFIVEAIIISLLSLILSFGFLKLLKQGLDKLWINRFFDISIQSSISTFFIFLGFSVLVGIIAGLLPSIFMSAFSPVQILKNIGSIKLFKRLTLRKVLLVTQFAVSLVFIISTILIQQQAKLFIDFNYGFDKDNIVNVTLYKSENYQRFAQALRSNKDILAVSACGLIPTGTTKNGTDVNNGTGENFAVNYNDIDAQCLNVWDLKLVAGRNLPDMPSTSGESYVLVNELCVKKLGFPTNESAVGQSIKVGGSPVEIAGVIKDCQMLDPIQKQEPFILRNRAKEFGFATIKIADKNTSQTLAFLEKTWKTVNPNTRYQYAFFDEQLAISRFIFTDLANILSFFALMAVVISVLGLLGMVTFTAESRQKEIGLRKVLGSSVFQILVLLSKGYLILIVIAVLIATPLAYFANNIWLQFLPNRVSISPLTLLFSIFILFVISLLTVFSQSWRAARVNPVKSLRTE